MALQRNSKLVTKKFIAYLIPSILMVFAMQFGSLIDGILIGQMIGTEALSATSLVMPILSIAQLPGFALGVGGSIVIANLLGKRDVAKAKKVFSFCLIMAFAISLSFTIASFFVSKPLASLFGEKSLGYSEPYVFGYLLTNPIIAVAMVYGSIMAVDNNPKLSSALYIVANVAKVGIEILLISLLSKSGIYWATFGAAISTGLGYLVGLLTVIFYIRSKKRLLKLTFKMKGAGLKEIMKASSTSALNMVLTAVQTLVVNIFIGMLVTSQQDLLAYGLISNMVFLFELLCGGVANLIPNLCSIFYGEKDFFSLKSLTKKMFMITIGITLVVTAVILITPQGYSFIFGQSDFSNFDHVAFLLRIYCLNFIGYEINKFSMNYYPSVDKNAVSWVVVLSRELVVVLPLTLSLLFAKGLEGYCWANVLNETITVLITCVFIFFYNRKKKIYKGLLMLEELNVVSMDVSLDNEINNASVISEELTKFALANKVPERESQLVGLASEEMVNNIVTYGYKKNVHSYIDVNLKVLEDKLILRIRDDGMPFDPTKYEFDEDEDYSTSGILLIKKLTDKMNYMRVLNLNNTVFEINTKGVTNNGN
ncbi:MAG: ATP-binding protein [Bacilli bacterium]|nr:ATP-binding protein [Bacilli bacterium]